MGTLVETRHEAVEQLPLRGHAHHFTLLLLLRTRVVQQVWVVAHLPHAHNGQELAS